MRRMYDSVTARDIPLGAELVGGYVDGSFRWSDADWARFPNAVKVRIAALPSTDDGHVLDVEAGDATPEQAPPWVQMRRAAGADPTVYTGAYQWAEVRKAFDDQGVPEPHYWIAQWDNSPVPLEGAVAKQYANPTLAGGHYDLSSVADYWPGIDAKEKTVDHPIYLGESVAVIVVNPNDPDPEKRVARMSAIFRWPDGRERTIERKAYGKATGMHPYVIYPPADPDADVTEDLDAQPGVFIVAVTGAA